MSLSAASKLATASCQRLAFICVSPRSISRRTVAALPDVASDRTSIAWREGETEGQQQQKQHINY